MEEKDKVKVKMKKNKYKDKVEDENSLEEGIPEVPSMQELLGTRLQGRVGMWLIIYCVNFLQLL